MKAKYWLHHSKYMTIIFSTYLSIFVLNALLSLGISGCDAIVTCGWLLAIFCVSVKLSFWPLLPMAKWPPFMRGWLEAKVWFMLGCSSSKNFTRWLFLLLWLFTCCCLLFVASAVAAMGCCCASCFNTFFSVITLSSSLLTLLISSRMGMWPLLLLLLLLLLMLLLILLLLLTQ